MKTRIAVAIALVGHISFITAQSISSPSNKLLVDFRLSERGEPLYEVFLGKQVVIKPSKLGIVLRDAPPLLQGFTRVQADTLTHRDVWQPLWGEVREITNHYRELAVTLRQTETNRTLILRFRAFDDGMALRYEFPAQPDLTYFVVADEKTQFQLAGDHKTFWIPGDYDSNEYPYYTSLLSEVDATVANRHTEIGCRTIIGKNFIQTPLLMNSAEGLYISLHEAALINYPAMHLEMKEKSLLVSHLVPDAAANKAYLQTPFHTPWRTLIVSNKAADLLASKTILNLNEPAQLKNTDWIKPQKFVGVWWEMHAGISTWSYADQSNLTLRGTNWQSLKPTGRHGATTENTKTYIDFAAENGFDGVLIEGWNVGWEDWFGRWKEDVFDFVTPYPDFSLQEVQRYASDKKVKLIMHHETSSSVTNYERRLNDAI
jgi:hypothetical protein